MRIFKGLFSYKKKSKEFTQRTKPNFKKYVVLQGRKSFDTIVEMAAYAQVTRKTVYKYMIDQHELAFLIQTDRSLPATSKGLSFVKFDDQSDYDHFLAGVVTINRARL